MALIIAITYSLSDDVQIVDPNIITTVDPQKIVTNFDVNETARILNATEIFTMLLGMNWPIAGNQ